MFIIYVTVYQKDVLHNRKEQYFKMKISELFKEKEQTLSFEVFPPKSSESFDKISSAISEIAALKPDYMSVTYGAGGTNRGYAKQIAALISASNVTSLAHLTCVGSSKEYIKNHLAELKDLGISNILALRGDLPQGMESISSDFNYASELTEFIKSESDFCVGGACYPEMHPQSSSVKEDIINLKKKTDAGCDFLVTQMFFDNNILYNYLFKIREAGITVPVVAGIMPVTNASQIKRICTLSGTKPPAKFLAILDKFGSDENAMRQAGIAYATDQIIDLLANGIGHIHVYSMNKPEVAESIKNNLSHII